MIRRSSIFDHWPPGKPRASGDDPASYGYWSHDLTVNPARAGMIRLRPRATPPRPRKPRASGDDPVPFAPLPTGSP